MQTRSATSRELYDTISALISETDKLDLSALLNKQNERNEEIKSQEITAANYLQALLGLKADVDGSPLECSSFKSKPIGNRQRSVSFSTPEVMREGSRGPGGLASDLNNSPVSPIRMRPHSSEAGSPTLDQALLMGRDSPNSDAGYGSFQSGTADITSLTEFRRGEGEEESLSPNSRPGDRSYSPGEPRATLASLLETDLAVSQAAQKLHDLKEKQAAIRAEVAGGNAPDSNLLYALLSQNRNNDYRRVDEAVEREAKREKLGFNEMNQLDRDLRDIDKGTLDILGDRSRDPLALERAARQYRNAASVHEANCTWSGQLPPKQPPGRSPSYSSKIFLGGVPWDITESALVQAFMEFGPVRVEWPGRESASPPRGYLYIVFEDEDRVKELLAHCTHDYSHGGSYYFKIASKKRGTKEIQIIPWLVVDSNYVRFPSPRLDPKKTVFVGALHGMINAQSLAVIFNELFGGVVYAGLDTDKHKYPIGSGRVTFNNPNSYMKAVATAFIEIKTSRFSKKIQVDPYLEDALCSVCHIKQGPYFCRDLNCFNYYCRGCWDQQHAQQSSHKPLMRNIRGLTRARLQDVMPGSPDFYTPLYQSNRENKIFSEYWGPAEQDKRAEPDNWRASCQDKTEPWRPAFEKNELWTRSSTATADNDNWRSGSLEKSSDYWRTQPEITWRNQENTANNPALDVSWSTNTENLNTWGDDYSKITSEFDNFCISERNNGLKPFLDREAPSFRSGFEREPPALRSSFANSFRPLVETEAEHVGFSTRRENSFARDLETIGYPREQSASFTREQSTSFTREQLHSFNPREQQSGFAREQQRVPTFTPRELRSFQPRELHSGSSSFQPRAEQQSSFNQLLGSDKLTLRVDKLRASCDDSVALRSLIEDESERIHSFMDRDQGGCSVGEESIQDIGEKELKEELNPDC